MDATQNAAQASELEFSDQDIFEAMRELPDYLDISTEDFRALYHCAYRHAQTRVTPPAAPPQAPQTLEPPRVAAVQLFRAWIGSLIGIALVFLLLFLALPLAAVFAEALGGSMASRRSSVVRCSPLISRRQTPCRVTRP